MNSTEKKAQSTTREQSRVRAVLFPVLSVFIGIFLAFSILEVVLRFFPVYTGLYAEPVSARQPVLRFIPNVEFLYSRGWNFRGVNIGHVHNFGFINDQDYDPTVTSPLAAVIGDSYIEAAMVPFGKTLQGRLAETVRGKGRVYSYAMSGAPLSQYLAWASWIKTVFHPDLLIVTIVGNDFDESLIRYKNEPSYHYFDDSREGMPLVRVDMDTGFLRQTIRLSAVSALSRYIRQNLGLSTIVRKFRASKSIQYVGNVPASVEAERIERSKRAVDAFLVRLPQEAGVPASRTIFIVDGMRPNLYSAEDLQKAEGSFFDTMRRYFIAHAAPHGYTVIDMQPRFIEHYRATGERFEYPDDGHWNETGHAVAAEAVKKSRVFRDRFGL